MKAVILAGGGGTRLFPLSTPEKPKQFLKLVSEITMLEETIDRLDFLKNEDIYIAINKKHLELTKQICPFIPEKNIIIEPDLRDTASCIGFASSIIEKRHPKEVMVIIYADHIINNKEEFQEKLKIASSLAKQGYINIIEVTATTPNTNYGYVKTKKLFKKIEQTEVWELDSFTEKPDKKTAEKFIKSGNYLWNTGIYVWRSDKILSHFQDLQPETYKKLKQISKDYDTKKQETTTNLIYPTLEKISIDYAIMEKIDPREVLIIKANLGWMDIGNFEVLYEELEKRGLKDKIREFKKIQKNKFQKQPPKRI